MRTIKEYHLHRHGVSTIELPKNAKIISAEISFPEMSVYIFAEVDTEVLLVKETFIVLHTGEDFAKYKELQQNCVHVASSFGFHIYKMEIPVKTQKCGKSRKAPNT